MLTVDEFFGSYNFEKLCTLLDPGILTFNRSNSSFEI